MRARGKSRVTSALSYHEFAGTRVPVLSEALEFIQRRSVALIERKVGEAFHLVKLLREKHLINKVIVQSFDWSFLRAHRSALHANIPRGQATTRPDPAWVAGDARPTVPATRLWRVVAGAVYEHRE